MKAVILAGGKGTRLSPYTTVYPKPMLPIGEMPILEIILRQLAFYGFTDIYLSVGYLSEIIEAYFNEKKSICKDVNITYIKEESPLGTAGSLSLLPEMDEPFIVMNGDVLTSLNFSELMDYHRSNKTDLTISVTKKDVRIDLGIVEFDDNGKVTDYIEKPTYTHYDSMGIYIYSPDAIKYISKDSYLDFPTLVKNMLADGKHVSSYCSSTPYYWIDMGRQGDYESANKEFEKRRKDFLPHENITSV